MGSSAMGASVLRKKVHAAGFADVTVVNKAISSLTDTYDLVVTHQDLTDRARQKTGSAVHVSVENFMNSPKYDEIVELLEQVNGEGAATGVRTPTPLRRRTAWVPGCSTGSRSCSTARVTAGTPRSPGPVSCWWLRVRSRRRTSTRCTRGRSRCRPTWATCSPSRTAPTRPSRRSGRRRSRSCATRTASTGTARRSSSWSASPPGQRPPQAAGPDRRGLPRLPAGRATRGRDHGRRGARRPGCRAAAGLTDPPTALSRLRGAGAGQRSPPPRTRPG